MQLVAQVSSWACFAEVQLYEFAKCCTRGRWTQAGVAWCRSHCFGGRLGSGRLASLRFRGAGGLGSNSRHQVLQLASSAGGGNPALRSDDIPATCASIARGGFGPAASARSVSSLSQTSMGASQAPVTVGSSGRGFSNDS